MQQPTSGPRTNRQPSATCEVEPPLGRDVTEQAACSQEYGPFSQDNNYGYRVKARFHAIEMLKY